MSRRELIALGVNIVPREEVETVTNKNMSIENPRVAVVAMTTTNIQVNLFYNVTDSSLAEEKKMHQKAAQGFPKEQKHKGDSKHIIKFFECTQSKSEEFGWDSIAANIRADNASLFETPGELTILDCKVHCDPK